MIDSHEMKSVKTEHTLNDSKLQSSESIWIIHEQFNPSMISLRQHTTLTFLEKYLNPIKVENGTIFSNKKLPN